MTLIEVTVVIAIMAFLLSVVTVAVVRVLRVERRMRDAVSVTLATSELSQQLRRDVYKSRSMALSKSADERDLQNRLTLAMLDQSQVVYTIEPRFVSRESIDGQKVSSREAFRLRDDTWAKWSIHDANMNSFVSLNLYRLEESGKDNSPPALQISALVGRDLRFLD